MPSGIFVVVAAASAAWAPGGPRSQPPPQRRVVATRRVASSPSAGFLDDLQYKFRNAGTMATVQHVLVDSEDKVKEVQAQVEAAGATFDAMEAAAASSVASSRGEMIWR